MRHQPIVVLVADDHHLFANLLTVALIQHPDLHCLPATYSVADAVQAVRLRPPHVVIADLMFGPLTNAGLDLVRDVKSVSPTTKVLMLTAVTEYYCTALAIAAGADGCLHKTGALEDVVNGVRAVYAGNCVLPEHTGNTPPSSRPTAANRSNRSVPRPPQVLTTTEIELLRRLAHGELNPRSSDPDLARAMIKLGAPTPQQAVLSALHLGLIS